MASLSSPRRPRRRGAVAAQAALCMTVLVGVAALTLDGGILLVERRHAQAAADAAALAAGIDLVSDVSPYTTTKQTAQSAAAANYADAGHLIVTANIPPTSGTFANTAKYPAGNYVEVVVRWDQPRGFSGVFGSGSVPVLARAVARVVKSTWGASILTLDSGAAKGLELSGGSVVQVPGAVLIDATNSSTALRVGGGGITAPKISIVGGYTLSGGATASPTPVTGVTPTADPLTSLAAPALPGLPSPLPAGWVDQNTIWKSPGGNVTINPGRYAGIRVDSGTVTMNPGTYYITGTGSSSAQVLLIQGSSTKLTGNGVFIYNGYQPGGNSTKVGQMQFKSGAQVTLTPPTSGTYQGINIFQDRNATAQITISGGSGTNIAGMVYAPAAFLSATGGSNIVPGSAFIVGSMLISGGGTMILPVPSIPVPISGAGPTVRLVE